MTAQSDRRTILTKNLGLEKEGLEIRPLDRPIVPKADGRIFYCDYLSRDELHEKYRDDERVSSYLIQDVDIVIGPSGVGDSVGSRQFSYVLAAHVLQYLPDPLKWLNEVHGFLEPGGIISLAIPDGRYGLDRMRRLSTAADWIGSWLQRATKATPTQVLDALSNEVRYQGATSWSEDIDLHELTHSYHPRDALRIATGAVYSDDRWAVRCWVFTPASFCDLLRWLSMYGLLNFSVLDFHDTVDGEFFVQLQKNEEFSWAKQIASIPVFREGRHKTLPDDFDAEFYLNKYPDVVAARIDPAEHYLEYGRAEGRTFCEPTG